jgi:hypothetical protein
MRIRFKALSPSDEDLSKTRPEGPAARQRASSRAPKPSRSGVPATDPKREPDRSGVRTPVDGQRREATEKIRVRAPVVVEERAAEPKRKDPRRE